ncbi:albusnodin/ikarugamycin family macrolactam cyclase [Kitasatospora sp. NPDC059827]|uniref:albusnodin/ikarugamycin family macrolactam cyclase n=1 Tax=Kitasatospora sp. NPDC059827 TaxID=3346964 RepID=UPI0036565C79
MIFGGFSTTRVTPRPHGSRLFAEGSRCWRLGDGSATMVTGQGGARRVLVLGLCGASDFELSCLADTTLPPDVAWRWPGAYAVVEETADSVVVHTDPAAAHPVYATRYAGGWAWSTSARMLASLTGAAIDTQRLACAVFLPSVPALAGTRSFFADIELLNPGHRIELPADGGSARRRPVWRPEPLAGRHPGLKLHDALAAAVALRTTADPDLSSDLSGGLDSSSVAVLAADSLPAGHRLNAVTVHPDGNQAGADLRYARLVATRSGRIDHCLLPLTGDHLPYTAITEIPVTDEPPPSTLTRARLTAQFIWMRDEFGTRTHLTGDGGDSVLFQPPIHLADLIRHRRLRRAVSEATGWARLRHTGVPLLLRDATRAARTSRTQALHRLAETVGTPGRNDHGTVIWFPLVPFPAWAEPPARYLLVQAGREAVAAEDPLTGLDASVRVLVDEIREIARTATADAALAAVHGIDLQNPFLDSAVVDTVLRTPLDQRPALHRYKPHLASAMVRLLPTELVARTTKGSFDTDHYAGMRANLQDLTNLADGYLAALGLLHPARFRHHLRQAAAGLPMPLATIEQALAAEAWLATYHRAPAPDWTYDQARSNPDD